MQKSYDGYSNFYLGVSEEYVNSNSSLLPNLFLYDAYKIEYKKAEINYKLSLERLTRVRKRG